MIIDGHAHACGRYLTAESIIENLDKNGVDKLVLVPGELGSEKDYNLPNIAKVFPQANIAKVTNELSKIVIRATGALKDIKSGNEYVYNLVKETQGRVIQFIWITQLEKKPIHYLDEKFKEWKFSGVKFHQCWEKFSVDSIFFSSVAEWAEEHNLPVFIHIASKKEAEKLISYKKEHPELKLIVAHLFGLSKYIESDIKDTNLYFDISPFQLNSTPRVLKAIEHFGAKQILFGSDTPYGSDSLERGIKRIKELSLRESDKADILGENLLRLLK